MEGLKTYQAVGKFGVNADNSQTVDPNAHAYAGIFGTDGSSTKWKWDYPAAGDTGASFGWINRQLIASGKLLPHMNAFGGEDRFWMGPEGGQFSIFFAPGVKFDIGPLADARDSRQPAVRGGKPVRLRPGLRSRVRPE